MTSPSKAVEIYCVKCKAKTASRDIEAVTMKNGRAATRSTCVECGTRSSVSASFPDRLAHPGIMALDQGLTTHQLLSALDGAVLDARTYAQRLGDTIDRTLTVSTDAPTFRTAVVGRRPCNLRPHRPRGPAGSHPTPGTQRHPDGHLRGRLPHRRGPPPAPALSPD